MSGTKPSTVLTESSERSRDSYTDLLTFAFDGPVPYDRNKPIYIDAEDQSCALDAHQFRFLVRSLIAGLKAHGVQRGDCVVVHIPNSVSSFPTFG